MNMSKNRAMNSSAEHLIRWFSVFEERKISEWHNCFQNDSVDEKTGSVAATDLPHHPIYQ